MLQIGVCFRFESCDFIHSSEVQTEFQTAIFQIENQLGANCKKIKSSKKPNSSPLILNLILLNRQLRQHLIFWCLILNSFFQAFEENLNFWISFSKTKERLMKKIFSKKSEFLRKFTIFWKNIDFQNNYYNRYEFFKTVHFLENSEFFRKPQSLKTKTVL